MNQKTYQNVDQNHKICKRKQRQGKQPTKQESERARSFSQVRIVSGNDSKQFCRQ